MIIMHGLHTIICTLLFCLYQHLVFPIKQLGVSTTLVSTCREHNNKRNVTSSTATPLSRFFVLLRVTLLTGATYNMSLHQSSGYQLEALIVTFIHCQLRVKAQRYSVLQITPSRFWCICFDSQRKTPQNVSSTSGGCRKSGWFAE